MNDEKILNLAIEITTALGDTYSIDDEELKIAALKKIILVTTQKLIHIYYGKEMPSLIEV